MGFSRYLYSDFLQQQPRETIMKSSVQTATAILVSLFLFAGVARAGAVEEVNIAEDARYDAMIKNDLVTFDTMLGNEFVYHQPTGKVVNKAQYIESLRSGAVKINSAVRENVTINVVGDTATAMGETKVDLVRNGEAGKVLLRYLNVWTKRDGRWQLIARQSALVPAK